MFTVYDTDKDEFTKVEEPDPSLSYTYADYLKWNFEERVELFRGKIYYLPTPYTRHQEVLGNLLAALYYSLKGKGPRLFAPPFDIRLPLNDRKLDHEIVTVVQPDISIICDDSKIDERGCCGAPDLVVEILSPGSAYKEVRLKYELYEEAGVKEYWIIFPGEESVVVFSLSGTGKYCGAAVYTTDDIIYSKNISGLTIILNDIFTK